MAVYGGSFNPPHVGHALVAAWVGWSGLADAVWLLPSCQHPFGRPLAPFARRVELCQALARAVGPRVSVCEVERDLPPPNFTIDVLEHLAATHPGRRFRCVIGADVVADLPRWHRWPDIAAQFAPIAVGRQGYPTPPGAVDFPAVSSTEIRRRIAAGEAIDALVPAAVRERLGDLYAATEVA